MPMRSCVCIVAAIVGALGAAVACRGEPLPPARPVAAAPVGVGPDAGSAAGRASGAVPLDQDLPQLAQRSLAMYQDVAKAFAASGEDCAAAAGRLGQLAGIYHDVALANAKVLRDGRARQLQAALDPHGEAFDDAARAIMQSPTMSKCAQTPAFAKAFDALLEAPP
jgi:hypothetical protein